MPYHQGMDYKYTLTLIDKLTAPARNMQQAVSGFSARADKLRASIKGMTGSLADISKFDTLKSKSRDAADALGKQGQKLAELRQQIEATQNPSNALIARFQREAEKLQNLQAKHQGYRQQLVGTLQSLRTAGVNTRDLAGEQHRLSQHVDQAKNQLQQQKATLDRWTQSTERLQGSMARLLTTGGKVVGFARSLAKVATAGAVATVGLGTGLLAANRKKGEELQELIETAKSVNVSTETLQVWRFAAKPKGLEADKVSDIFKDVSDKVGDYSLTGGGEAKDLFEKLKLKIKDFKKLAPDQIMLKIGAALDKSKLTQSEKIFLMEGLADDASKVLSLIENQGAALTKAGEEAKAYGLLLSDAEKAAFQQSQKSWLDLSNRLDGIKNRAGSMLNDVLLNSGAFDWLKSKIESLKGYTDKAQEWLSLKIKNGDLNRWLDTAKSKLKTFAIEAWTVGKTIWDLGLKIVSVVDKLASFVGGWDKLLIGLASFMALSSVLTMIGGMAAGISALVSAISLITGIGSIAAAPFLLVGAAIGGVVVAGWYLYKNWDKLTRLIKEKWDALDFSLPSPLQFIIDLNPLNLFFGRVEAFSVAWGKLYTWVSKPLKFLVDLNPLNLIIGRAGAFKSAWLTVMQFVGKPLRLIIDLNPLNLLLGRVNAFKSAWLEVVNWLSKLKLKWPHLPTIELPKVLQFMVDLSPLNLALGRFAAFNNAWRVVLSLAAKPLRFLVDLHPINVFIGRAEAFKAAWKKLLALSGAVISFIFDLNPVNFFIGRAEAFKAAWQAVFDWIKAPSLEWPTIPDFKLPDFLDFEWPTLPDFEWPTIPEFKWPTSLTFAWPTLPEFKWPTIPDLILPDIKPPAPLQLLIDLNPLNLAIGHTQAFKGAWENVLAWSQIAFQGLSMIIQNGLATFPVEAFSTSGLSLQERWGMVHNWMSTNFPLLNSVVQAGLSVSPIEGFKQAGLALQSVWEGVINWFAEKFNWLMGMIDKAKVAASGVGGMVSSAASNLTNTVKSWMGNNEATLPSMPKDTIPSRLAANETNVRSTSEVSLKIESAAPVKIQSTRAGKGTNLNVDTGRMMLAP